MLSEGLRGSADDVYDGELMLGLNNFWYVFSFENSRQSMCKLQFISSSYGSNEA